MSYGNVEAIISALDQFESTDDTVYRLNAILENFRLVQDRESALPSMFALLERFPNADFGSPGPLVNEIEQVDGYHELLTESLSRLPTVYTVWMVNRIMNTITDGDAWFAWMQELSKVLTHPRADEGVRENARHFIEYQNERDET